MFMITCTSPEDQGPPPPPLKYHFLSSEKWGGKEDIYYMVWCLNFRFVSHVDF